MIRQYFPLLYAICLFNSCGSTLNKLEQIVTFLNDRPNVEIKKDENHKLELILNKFENYVGRNLNPKEIPILINSLTEYVMNVFLKANDYYYHDRLEQAIKLYKSIIEKTPIGLNDEISVCVVSSYYMLGKALMFNLQIEEAKKRFHEAEQFPKLYAAGVTVDNKGVYDLIDRLMDNNTKNDPTNEEIKLVYRIYVLGENLEI
jgi:tetratricopeptide (TPR) repeat protein